MSIITHGPDPSQREESFRQSARVPPAGLTTVELLSPGGTAIEWVKPVGGSVDGAAFNSNPCSA